MSIVHCILFSLIILLIITFPIIAIHSEWKQFNNGICPKCGTRLEYFDSDSQGGRGYLCEKCDYHTWVSWNTVDKKYRKKSR